MTFPDLIRSEEELLKRLLVVSQRQLEVAEAGEDSTLLSLLWQWEQLWNEFMLVDQQLAPYKGIPAEQRVWKSAAERQLTESALNRCEELLKTILENYQTCLTKMAERKDEAAEQVRRIQQGGSVAAAYSRQSKIADTSSESRERGSVERPEG